MATPEIHSLLSPSSSSRWLNCTAAPRFEESLGSEEKTSVYAEEGRLAHSFCETIGKYNFGQTEKADFQKAWADLKKQSLYSPEMEKTAEFYAEYLFQRSLKFSTKPHVVFEQQVEFTDYVPEGFGTCDCIMIGNNTLQITDYKHGKGVQVSANNNSQMRLYALGALKLYQMFFSIDHVVMAIVQPRITEEISEEQIEVDELLAWGNQIKPLAQMAYSGDGATFREGSWCRFCKGKAVCRARADNMTALEDFKSLKIEGQLTDEEKTSRERAAKYGFSVSPILSDAEIGDLLIRGEQLCKWYEDIKAYATEAILGGGNVPGWKVVEGRSARVFDDPDKAMDALCKSGVAEEMLYDRKVKTLAQIEKMLGKKAFADAVGSHVIKSPGKPTLVVEADKRAPYSAAAADFREAATQ